MHGDGLANVILSDGLANFCNNNEYKGKLRKQVNDAQKDNQQFDIVLSNPPYSVSSFRQTTRDYYTEQDFELYNSLTDNSSEIECLFVERTKQLLKDGGIAGVILPSSILSNSGVYTKAREIILQYFDIVAIAELGSNTFMATNTNTVVLFLRRRDNYFAANTKVAVETYFRTLNDVTINGIEAPASKYVSHVWDGLEYSDYITLLQKSPNDKVKAHEIYAEYKKKISAKTETKFWETLLGIETEKLLYFILAYPQKVVIVKSGEKDVEKRFLGYEFSNRRGNEGIHAIQRGKNIDECTQLFDINSWDNPDKASTYVYRAFKGDYVSPIAENMQSHISRISLVDMLSFERETFEKFISTTAKKKVKFSDKWKYVRIPNSIDKINGSMAKIPESDILIAGKYPVYTQDVQNDFAGFSNNTNPITDVPVVLFGDHSCAVKFVDRPFFRGADGTVLLKPKKEYNPKYYFYAIEYIVNRFLDKTKYERHNKYLQELYIPNPPTDIQRQIVAEIEQVVNAAELLTQQIKQKENEIENLLSSIQYGDDSLKTISPFATKSIKYSDIEPETYITTDNMLQNKLGIVPFDGEANITSITEYKKEDILISNIRPYLKKIWFADKDGGCSKDVLVLRSADTSKYLPKYIFYMLRRDAFFDYVMEGKKGIKMPRGNKEDILKYRIPIPSSEEQQRIVSKVEKLEAEIKVARKVVENVASQKQTVLDRYL